MTLIRTGFGYDIHRLVPQRRLILGGVLIPSELGLLGHSDADVLLHAICDALLGGAALGDIGKHFRTPTKIQRRLQLDLAGLFELLEQNRAKSSTWTRQSFSNARKSLRSFLRCKGTLPRLCIQIDQVSVKPPPTKAWAGRGGLRRYAVATLGPFEIPSKD
jgi:2-C-methyl-D-erythritol 2,4-cyclodiphosphate synthase